MQIRRYFIIVLILLGLLLAMTGCGTLGYYSQAVGGHLKLMAARESVDKLMASDETDPVLKQKLQTLKEARQFAVERLHLPSNDSYSTYAATGRRYVTWNVVAAEEFSVQAKTWCFPVAGCVNYRGYFAEQSAEDYAAELSKENYDVNVGGALAYSTLGWFDDPILDTMLAGGDIGYVGTLFHELAHQLLYVKNDSNFNEAFASFVEQESIRTWLRERNELERIGLYDAHLKRSDDFSVLLQTTRSALQSLYSESLDADTMRKRKQATIEQMQSQYASLKAEWGGYSGYDGWFSKEINNARLVSVSTYRRYVPAFAAMFQEVNNDLAAFYALAKTIADLPPNERAAKMQHYLIL